MRYDHGDFAHVADDDAEPAQLTIQAPKKGVDMLAKAPHLAACIAMQYSPDKATTPHETMAVAAMFLSDAALNAERTEDEKIAFIETIADGIVRLAEGFLGEDAARIGIMEAMGERIVSTVRAARARRDPKAN